MPSSQLLTGHQFLLQSLESDLESGNVAHAYLFAGMRHLGKFTVAKWFGEKLLTVDAPEGEKEKAADQVSRLLHPDLFVVDQLWIEEVCEDFDVIAQTSNVAQQHRKKAGARTDTISIDDIRVLQERMHEVSTGRFRCCLIRSMERMQAEAVNALLKILEEPPPGVVFLLTTQTLSSLLPTLVSRTRVMRFSRVPEAELQPLVRDLAEDDAQFLLRFAQGCPGIIQELRDDPDRLRAERLVYDKAMSFWQTHLLSEKMAMLTPLHERGEEAAQFLLHLSIALREQSPAKRAHLSRPLTALIRGMQTNVSRQLLTQQFALATHP